ncbi:unnamed protein product [Microthlaspi erraticum]|uniref:BIG2 domain-containing protein n=1 Tax=Microthlaspi erraticum TaxID=1685480 RepID=A0A6D2I9I2_9BRAS|nr:unnamed protein product [Microthlaspi erraticum]
MLSVGGASPSDGNDKNPSDLVRFTLNRKPMILLQWTPHVSREIKLNVRRGGCANATNWRSSNRNIVDVSSYGVIQGKSSGIATVKAVSTCYPQGFDECSSDVVLEARLCWLNINTEALTTVFVRASSNLLE